VCNPNAPTGTVVPAGELASLAAELKGVLLIDEAYVDFAEFNCVSLAKDFANVIVLRSLSKGYSLAGLRFGYAIAHKDLIDGLIKVKDSYNVDAVAIALATAAIKDQAYFRQNVEKIKQERQLLTERLRALGFAVRDSSSNFVFAHVKTGSAARIQETLAQRNIFVRYWNAPGISDKLRISVGTKEQNEKLIEALKEILSGGGDKA
jgi:histidinol-phosphate aminotransferase